MTSPITLLNFKSMFPQRVLRSAAFLFCIALSGCATKIPVDILKTPVDQLAKRQQQSRLYETADEANILSASSGVLQDLGFTIDGGESTLGVVFASKDRKVDNGGQLVTATFLTALAAAGGSSSYNYYNDVEKNQKIRVAVVTQRASDGSKMLVRVNFQRLVWTMSGQLSKIETLQDEEMYAGFFDKLSKAIFLEEQKL